MINIPKGTKDVLPQDSYKWHEIYRVIESLSKKYNLKEIMTPTFESTELFLRSVGDSSDVVNKEMYTFLDKGERSITLKPEGTAGVVRSFVENGLFNNAMPLKTYYKTPCFRYERPQAGRLREHHQFGVEMFGSNSVYSELEIFMILSDFFGAFGIKPTFSINYLGCDKCNELYKQKLRECITPKLSDFCADCKVRYNKNILRMLDCKVPSCKELLRDIPKFSDCLCEDCRSRYAEIKKGLSSLGIKYVENDMLVRGLDYYTGTVFEIINIDKENGQTALGAGGRYNKLVEELGGKSVPVIGFGVGIERFILYLESIGYKFKEENNVDIYLASTPECAIYAMQIAKTLRDKGIGVETDLMERGLKAQFKYADKLNTRYVGVIGSEEMTAGEITIKDMSTGEQNRIKVDDVAKYITK